MDSADLRSDCLTPCRDHGVGYEGTHGLGCGCPPDPATCTCFLDNCFGEDCPYCAVADPELPCPIADSARSGSEQ